MSDGDGEDETVPAEAATAVAQPRELSRVDHCVGESPVVVCAGDGTANTSAAVPDATVSSISDSKADLAEAAQTQSVDAPRQRRQTEEAPKEVRCQEAEPEHKTVELKPAPESRKHERGQDAADRARPATKQTKKTVLASTLNA